MRDRGAALKRSHTWARSEVQQRCDTLNEEWEELEESLDKRAVHLNKALAREQVGTEKGHSSELSMGEDALINTVHFSKLCLK